MGKAYLKNDILDGSPWIRKSCLCEDAEGKVFAQIEQQIGALCRERIYPVQSVIEGAGGDDSCVV